MKARGNLRSDRSGAIFIQIHPTLPFFLPGQTGWVTRLLGVCWVSCQLTPSISRGHSFWRSKYPLKIPCHGGPTIFSLCERPRAEEVSQFEDGRLPTINIVAQLSGRRNLIKPRRGSLSPSNCSYFFWGFGAVELGWMAAWSMNRRNSCERNNTGENFLIVKADILQTDLSITKLWLIESGACSDNKSTGKGET